MNYIENIKERVKSPEITQTLNEEMMWQKHGPLIWKADRFEGTPAFYPVYNWKNYYSYSLLTLIVKKGHLNLNQAAFDKASKEEFIILLAEELIDNDIIRIGGPVSSDCTICDPVEYTEKVAQAVMADVREVEKLNPDFVNLVMCGGKDSLNLLLIPWGNPVVALSAEPNYSLVCTFIKKNNLDIEVRRLDDLFDEEMLEEEILECCCRVDMTNWRWGADLRKIVGEYNKEVVIWKGQSGNLLLTPDWKTFIWPPNKFKRFFARIYKKTSHLMPDFLKYWIGEKSVPQSLIGAWQFPSVRLGVHMAYIRMLCSSLALCAYSGRHMTALFKRVNLARAVQDDIREDLGKLLLGRKVWYPDKNPGPPLSSFRIELHKPMKFIKLLRENSIKVDGKIG